MFVRKKSVFREKLRCDSLDIQVRNLVHKQDLCTIRKNDKGIPCINSKNEKPSKNVISWIMD
jgi:hypothetical protein